MMRVDSVVPVCLVADIGNTSVAVALAQGERIGRMFRLPGATRDGRAVAQTLRRAMGRRRPDGAALASVVPAALPVWRREMERVCGHVPLTVHHRLDLGVKVEYPKPAAIGADRLANASGAVARYGAPVIVADFGTAVTFDVISAAGAYVGGVIAPGLPLMTDYLCDRTAMLPRVRLGGNGGRRPIGRSTEAAMRVGARVGYGGMVAAIVKHIREGLDMRHARLCATGGFARWVLREADLPFVFDPDLTLYGIARILRLNSV
jgi:type III pantothenate kinase